jgi:hypothetical protein
MKINIGMNANNAIGKSFVDIRDILSDDEKLALAKMWNAGFSKNWVSADLLLRNNVVECIQPRRHTKEGFKDTRHMMCTRNFWLASRLAKIRGLKMKVDKPRGNTWYRQRNLIMVWDIVYNDWRMIDMKDPNQWRILDFVPFQTDEHFQQVASLWSAHMRKTKPDGVGARTYCNFIRKGV